MNHAATAQQQAYIFLQDQIVSGVLAGGSRLHLETISHKLGISRMPIREAIRQLDAEGYVTIRPNRGAVVTSRTPEQVVELFEIRAALEGLAMRLSIPRVTDDAIEDLKLECLWLIAEPEILKHFEGSKQGLFRGGRCGWIPPDRPTRGRPGLVAGPGRLMSRAKRSLTESQNAQCVPDPPKYLGAKDGGRRDSHRQDRIFENAHDRASISRAHGVRTIWNIQSWRASLKVFCRKGRIL